jgi:hypothetical protein
MTVNEQRLHGTTDAQVWAEEFCKHFGITEPRSDSPGDRIRFVDDPEALMIGWFANAIETAIETANTHSESSSPESFEFSREPDGTLPLRSAVYQALGAASTCWIGYGWQSDAFDSVRAQEIGEALMCEIERAMLP